MLYSLKVLSVACRQTDARRRALSCVF